MADDYVSHKATEFLSIINRLTDRSNPEFDERVFQTVRTRAYFLAEKENFSRPQEYYWDAAKLQRAYDSAVLALP